MALDATALIVVDMQNAYASEGGYVDTVGFDVSGAKAVISNVARAVAMMAGAGFGNWSLISNQLVRAGRSFCITARAMPSRPFLPG